MRNEARFLLQLLSTPVLSTYSLRGLLPSRSSPLLPFLPSLPDHSFRRLNSSPPFSPPPPPPLGRRRISSPFRRRRPVLTALRFTKSASPAPFPNSPSAVRIPRRPPSRPTAATTTTSGTSTAPPPPPCPPPPSLPEPHGHPMVTVLKSGGGGRGTRRRRKRREERAEDGRTDGRNAVSSPFLLPRSVAAKEWGDTAPRSAPVYVRV